MSYAQHEFPPEAALHAVRKWMHQQRVTEAERLKVMDGLLREWRTHRARVERPTSWCLSTAARILNNTFTLLGE